MDAVLEQKIRVRIAEEKARTEPPPEAVPVPLIPVGRYVDLAFYALERDHVFGRSWLFAGHESEWPDPGSYRQFNRTGSPIVIVRPDTPTAERRPAARPRRCGPAAGSRRAAPRLRLVAPARGDQRTGSQRVKCCSVE